MARRFTHQRGLDAQIEPEDIHNDVVGDLMKASLRELNPAYEDFRRFVTTVTRNAVHRRYIQIHGDFCCGACAFFLEESKGMPSRCGNFDLQPARGQKFVQVNYGTNPRGVTHSEGTGCKHYSPIQCVDLGGLGQVTMPDDFGVEETLREMESLGPRQRKQASLLRLMLAGYKFEEVRDEISRIAALTGKHRTTISKELHGTNEKESDDAGNEVDYHQAGAYDLFLAIYTGAADELKNLESKKEKPQLWPVVDRRDFSADEIRPAFNRIGNELGATKLQAVERYKAGWQLINKLGAKGGGTMTGGKGGGGTMAGGKDDHSEGQPGQAPPRRRIAKASEMQHPAFQALLSYAEDALDREARKRIAAHVLICESCSAELEHIETNILPEMERPISVMERLSWLAARLVGQLRGAQTSEPGSQARLDILTPAISGATRGEADSAGAGRRESETLELAVQKRANVQMLALQGADETYRFLTVLDEDEAGELYVFMSIYGERKGPVYCWPIESAQVELPFILDETERHRYQVYLTDREVPVLEGVHLDLRINNEERNEERARLLAAFLEALESGGVNYRTAELEFKP
jgi:hypothetical protein